MSGEHKENMDSSNSDIVLEICDETIGFQGLRGSVHVSVKSVKVSGITQEQKDDIKMAITQALAAKGCRCVCPTSV